MKEFFEPKSIAVIGASQDKSKAGYIIVKNLLRKGFKGKVYPVSPKYNSVFKLKCFSSIKDIKDDIDMAVIAVNANLSNIVIKECVDVGVKAIVVITAGYREIGNEGIKREKELIEIIKKGNSRVLGPNCLGVFDNIGNVDLLFLPENKMNKPRRGNISFVSQSGAIGAAFIDKFAGEELGISRFISYGNAVDVNETDIFNFLENDKKTKCVIAYIEGVKDGRRFFKSIKNLSDKKPVIVLKAGKTKKGTSAAASHTGTLAGAYEVFKGVLKQANVVEANSEEELYDYGKIFSFYDKVRGKKVAVVTNGGGFGVVSSDMIEKYGLELPDFSKRTYKDIAKFLPSYASVHNPLDLIGDASEDRYFKAIDVLIKDRNVDMILVLLLFQTFSLEKTVIYKLSELRKRTEKPIVAVSMGSKYTNTLIKALGREGIPCYETPERAIKSMKALYIRSCLSDVV